MPRIKKMNRQTARNLERRRAAWELYRAGAVGAEIGKALGVTRQHAMRLVRQERDLLLADTRWDVEGFRIEEISRTGLVIREVAQIMTAPCRNCKGGLVWPDGPVTLPEDMVECPACAGPGRRYPVDDRLKAMDKFLRAVDMRANLRGLYEASKIRLVDEEGHDRAFYKELEQVGDDDLERELSAFMAELETTEEGRSAADVLPVQRSVHDPNGGAPSRGYHD